MKGFILSLLAGAIAFFGVIVFSTGFVSFVHWQNLFIVNIGDLHPFIRMLIAVVWVMCFIYSFGTFMGKANKEG